MPPSRNNTVRFTDLQAISSVNAGDIIPVVDTSVPTLVNKKINVQDFSRSLPVGQQVAQMGAVSANWDSSYSTTLANSASWSTGGSYGSVYSANSAEYENTYTSVNANSANWDSAYNTVQASSAEWTGLTTYTTVNSLSDNWNSGFSAYSSFNILSTGYWLLKAGDQITGSLTTTKTLTTQFTNSEEFISKRYVDALAFQTQVSGNFIPALYYTKNETDTGFVSRTNAIVNPTWNNSAVTFTGLTVSASDISSSASSLLLDLKTNESSKFSVGKDGFIYFNGKYNTQAAVIGFLESGGTNIVFKTDGLPTHNKFVIGPTENVGYLNAGAPNFIGWSGSNDPTTSQADTRLYRDSQGVLALRRGINNPHALRIYNTFTDATNYERLSLSATLIQTEFAGTGRAFDLSITAAGSGNLVLSGANFNVNNRGQLFLSDPQGVNYISGIYSGNASITQGVGDWGFRCRGNTVLYIQGQQQHVMISYVGALGWDNQLNTGQGTPDVALNREAAGILGQRSYLPSTIPQAYRIYNTYTNANNYERLSLSATRIAYEFAGTGVSRDLTISTPGNLILSGAAISFNTATPFAFGTLSLSADRIRLPRTNATSSDPHISIAFNDNMYWLSDGSNYVRTGAGPSIIFGSYADQGGFATRINGVANSLNFWLTRDSSICWNTGNPSAGFTETGDLFLFRDAPYVLAIRDRAAQTSTNALRIYNTYTVSSNYTRLSLSGSRIEFEWAGTGSSSFNSSIRKGAYGGIAYYQGNTWIGMFPGETGDFHLNSTKELKWGTGEQYWAYDLSLARDAADTLALRRSTNPNAFRIYNTYTDANNYERLSLSATRIAYEAAGTGVSRDLTIQSTGNIVLSAGGIVNISSGLPTSFSSLTANDITSVNNLYINNNLNRIYNQSGWITLEGSNGVFLQRNAQINGTYNSAALLTIQAQPGHTLPGSFIKCLSGDGKTLFEVNSAGSFTASSFTFPTPTDYLGTVRVLNDTAGILRPGIYSTGNGVSLATYGNGGLSNVGSAFIQHILGRRAVFSGSSPTVGGANFDETIPNVAIKVGGLIGFTDVSLDGSSFVRPISATMGYDWSSNLISVSSTTSRAGFIFESKSVQNQRSAIYYDTNDFLNISVGSGAGKTLQVRSMASNTNPAGDVFGSVSYSGWQMVNMSLANLNNPSYLGVDTLTITQRTNQTGSYVKLLSSDTTSTIFEVTSANNVFVRNLINFTNKFSTGPAIKGTSTTVQARTGDDSQYTYLQGKLQTDQAASAGTFTPDKYLILYDSTGTAYKVPVQAL
jgi:hypothetical protein